MKRLIAISLILGTALLAGCVVTPGYRYSGGSAGYYYGDGGGYGSSATVIYQDGYGYPYNPYNGYYYYGGAWVPYGGASVYYYDHDGHRYDRGYYEGGYYEGGHHRQRLSTAVRDQAAPRSQPRERRLSQPRPASRAERRQSDRYRERGWHDKRHRH